MILVCAGESRKTYPLELYARIVTVLFPHNASRKKGAMSRIAGQGFTGASVNLGGATDFIYESSGESDCTDRGVSFRAKVVVVRRAGSASSSAATAPARKGPVLSRNRTPTVTSKKKKTSAPKPFYFASKARKLSMGSVGFESDSDVSIYMKGMSGAIGGGGGVVTFRCPGVRGVKLDGGGLRTIEAGRNFVRVSVPGGAHTVTLSTSPVAPAARKMNAANVKKLDGMLLASLAKLSEAGPLKSVLMPMSISRSKVALKKATAAGVLTFATSSGKSADIDWNRMKQGDRVNLAILRTRLEPANPDSFGMVGAYYELKGRAADAERYFKKAGDSRQKFEALFQ